MRLNEALISNRGKRQDLTPEVLFIGGYLKKSGYETEWNKVCDEV
jgi:hypothetical protein